ARTASSGTGRPAQRGLDLWRRAPQPVVGFRALDGLERANQRQPVGRLLRLQLDRPTVLPDAFLGAPELEEEVAQLAPYVRVLGRQGRGLAQAAGRGVEAVLPAVDAGEVKERRDVLGVALEHGAEPRLRVRQPAGPEGRDRLVHRVR